MPRVVLRAKENGSLKVFVDEEKKLSLCRCGQSKKKPYCDDSHKTNGFTGPAVDIVITE